MTVSPFPGQIKRREVLDAAKNYIPSKPPSRPAITAVIWIGAVLILASVGVVLSVILRRW